MLGMYELTRKSHVFCQVKCISDSGTIYPLDVHAGCDPNMLLWLPFQVASASLVLVITANERQIVLTSANSGSRCGAR